MLDQRLRQLANLSGDEVLAVTTALAEKLAPVRPHAEPNRVLQRGSLVALAMRYSDKPADILLAL